MVANFYDEGPQILEKIYIIQIVCTYLEKLRNKITTIVLGV